ncbi:hypothetical protein [Flavobacterium sp. JAS]|uniref:hypothetical protein n=1 Tax=Flavobacterium sp. JAS TaxID=2897329 RepID=UPI001E2DDA02|nr:hypothetical protein [Flavobacterium sp. JAS]MCD0468729.1 hypothetical protein [Flavobacterium sp. JAS]
MLVPAMLIQPFVENAIIRGMGNYTDKGFIKLEIVLKKNQLLVKITANGKGYQNTSNTDGNHQFLSGL